MNPLTGISRNVDAIFSPSKLAHALTEIQAKTVQVAKQAISYVKTSFERVEQGVDAGFTEFQGKLENSAPIAKAATFFNPPHKDAASSEAKPKKEEAAPHSIDPRALKINQEMKELEEQKAIAKLSKDLNKEIDQIQSQPKKDANDKEKLERLKLMQGKLTADPNFFLKKMDQYGHGKSALYRHLQPIEFLSILVKSDQNIGILENLQKGFGNPNGLSEEERVALHHYTTKGYVAINQAGREAKLRGTPIKDPGMRACFELTTAALKKLPDAPAVDQNGVKVTLKRAYYPPIPGPDSEKNKKAEANFQAFVNKNFVKDNTFNDGSFLSTTTKEGPPGEYNVYFEIPEGSKTIPNGKKIGFPYSAFSSLDKGDEGEVLFTPDAEFRVSNLQGSRVTFQFI